MAGTGAVQSSSPAALHGDWRWETAGGRSHIHLLQLAWPLPPTEVGALGGCVFPDKA